MAPLGMADEGEDRLVSQFFDSHSVKMLLIDPQDGRITDANRSAEQFYGWGVDELRRKRISEINLFDDDQVRALWREAAQREQDFFIFPHRTRDQGVRSVAVYSAPVNTPSGDPLLLSIIHDVSDHTVRQTDAAAYREELELLVDQRSRELIEQGEQRVILQRVLLAGSVLVIGILFYGYRSRSQALAAAERTSFEARKLQVATDQSPTSILITDLDGKIEYVNQTCLDKTGYTREELIGQNPRMLQSGRTPKETYESLWATISQGRPWEGRLVNQRKDGTEYVEWVLINPVFSKKGAPIRFIAMKEDITEREALNRRLHALERYDRLTGLANRTAFFEAMDERLREAKEMRGFQTLVLINIDRFRAYNEANGHEVGDRLLCSLADQLREESPEEALIARTGADEFAVLPPVQPASVTTTQWYDRLRWIQDIHRSLRHADLFDADLPPANLSFGVAFSNGTCEPSELFVKANSALSTAKAQGIGEIAFYDAEAASQMQASLRLEQDLAQAIDRNELHLALQAQVGWDGTVLGAEALLRWEHPTHGMVSPARFIPLAEDSGQIIAIGYWVLEQALGLLETMQARNPKLTLSVNVSADQVLRSEFVSDVAALLSSRDVDPTGLVLEITESVFMSDPELARTRLAGLRALGVGVSLDDFGTGYSSLSYLKRLPITELKIDKAFVAGLPADPTDTALVNIIMSAAKQMALRVVAEGAETADQVGYFREHADVALQGYYFERPQPADAWMKTWLGTD